MKTMAQQSLTVVKGESIKEILDCYRLYLEAIGRSNTTIRWYLEILKRYFAFLELSGLLKLINKLGKSELIAYILHLQKAKKWPNNPHIQKEKGKLSPFSIQGHVRAIKAFWSWLFNQGYIETNPLAKFPLPKVPKNIIKTLTIEQIRSLLKAIDKNSSVGARNHMTLLLLIDTGLRISELTCIKMADINLTQGYVKVVGKGQKERIVPFSSFSRKELMKYINRYRLSLCSMDSDYLFPSKDSYHISVNSVQQMIKRLAIKAGLQNVKCHPHIFRHTFATMFSIKGGAPEILQLIMGHESFQTTQKYLHPQPQDLRKQHLKYSPVTDLFGGQN